MGVGKADDMLRGLAQVCRGSEGKVWDMRGLEGGGTGRRKRS